jgi:hypothetical protein
LHNTREAEASQNRADGTLSQKSRELEDGEVVDVTELAPEGHDIAQDVDNILEAVLEPFKTLVLLLTLQSIRMCRIRDSKNIKQCCSTTPEII